MTDMTQCAHCGARRPEEALEQVRRLFERVHPGDVMPSGQCPDCGCLCYPAEEETAEVSPAVAAVLSEAEETMAAAFADEEEDGPA